MARKLFLLMVALILSACNLPTAPTRPVTNTPDAVATQVVKLLTLAPTNTSAPAATVPAAKTDTPTSASPTPTTTNTVPAPATETTVPTLANNPPDWTDTLNGGKSFYKFENEGTKVTQEGGHLILSGLIANGWLGWSLTYSHKPANFRVEAVFTTQTCSGSDTYGLMFRAPNANSGYFYSVTCDGRYNLHVRDFDNDIDTVLINMTNGQGINAGSNMTNHLAVKAEGDKISLFANDTLLQEVTDATYSSGYFGPIIAANETPGFTVWMEEISLWNLP
jgi:hypothetical protein